MKRSEIVDNANIQRGDVIVGLSSTGKSAYEKNYNGGMGSNGLTSARHDVFAKYLKTKYPESLDPMVPEDLAYSGNYKLNDIIDNLGMDIGKLVLSPTRTYAPIIKEVLKYFRPKIHGMVHCSGGAQTKILHFIENLHIVKDNLFPVPPLFEIIQNQSKTEWSEMYKVFNMGHHFEIYTDSITALEIILISQKFNVEAKIVGHCDFSKEKKLTIKSSFGEFNYS